MEIVRAALGLAPDGYRIDDRLKELNYGHWEGMLQADLAGARSAWARRAREGSVSLAPETAARATPTSSHAPSIGSTASARHGRRGHGGVGRAMRAHLLGLDPATIPDLESPQDRVLVLTHGAMRWVWL